MKPSSIFAIAAAIASAEAAGQVYRCDANGKVYYSQVRCIGETKTVVSSPRDSVIVHGGKDEDRAEQMESGKAACSDASRIKTFFKDPDSVRIGATEGGKVGMRETARGAKMVVREFVVMVNARNSFGGYTGETPHKCTTSFDGKEIVSFR